MTDVTTVAAPVKSAWLSKINWLQIVSLGVTFATGIFGAFNLDPAMTAKATAGAAAVGQVLTIVLRTFFTTTITPSSTGGQ